VQNDALRSELDQLQTELAEARIQYTRVGAKIAGLEAQSEALATALSGMRGPRGETTTAKPRTEAIEDVLMAADTELAIKDVIAALHEGGRDESYDNVAADPAYLAERERIARLRRGVYNRPDRIAIPITEGMLNNSYIPLGNHLGFFPTDAVGEANARDGQGTMLTVHFAGLPDPVETDIAGIHKDFRRRSPVGKFLAHHGLRPGDKIAIEKISNYEYRVQPAR
jgi:hypothetical protein